MRPLAICALLALPVAAVADETSTGDKLRILYSSRMSFGERGMPLVTVEIMSGQREVHLGAPGGLVVRPDGAGASAVETQGGAGWVISAESTQPARLNPRYAASEAGSRKTPEPIMLPMTIDTAAQKPSTRCGEVTARYYFGAAPAPTTGRRPRVTRGQATCPP